MITSKHKCFSEAPAPHRRERDTGRALILDRDGVINVDYGYVGGIDRFVWCDGIKPLLRYFYSAGYRLFVVTNQSGIARGFYTEDQFLGLMRFIYSELEKEGVLLEAVFWCPHHPEYSGECNCRKPQPGMLLDLAAEYQIELGHSIFLGDNISDMLAGVAAGVGRLIHLCDQGGSQVANVWETIGSLEEIMGIGNQENGQKF